MSKKRIIVFSSNTAFSLYNFRLPLMLALKERGFDVITVAPEDDEYSKLLKEKVEFYSVKNLDRKGKNPIKDLKLMAEYYSLFKSLKPDLVINFTIKPNIYGSIACGMLKIPSISVITGLGYAFINKGLLNRIVRILYRIAFKFNKFIVFMNPDDMKELSQIAGENKSVLILSEGIDTEKFSPAICEKKEKDKFIFLFVGRFLKDKGILELVKAGGKLYEQNKNFEIWLLGSVDRGNPNSLSDEQIEDIKRLPFVKILPFTKDVRPIICDADCVILPSYYREGVPRVLLEAMSMEKPIITTDAPGCREVCIDGVNGFLVKPKDVGSLYSAMGKMIELKPGKLKEMGANGRKLVIEKYEISKIVNSYVKLIETL
uniref:Glycosyltransferase family 1 protein n=1 Tax=Thermodesulfobacterium geofontis TaxID=1295609 RepID=A0A7C4JQ43_9BACT